MQNKGKTVYEPCRADFSLAAMRERRKEVMRLWCGELFDRPSSIAVRLKINRADVIKIIKEQKLPLPEHHTEGYQW